MEIVETKNDKKDEPINVSNMIVKDRAKSREETKR